MSGQTATDPTETHPTPDDPYSSDWEFGDEDSLEEFIQKSAEKKRDWSEMVFITLRGFPLQLVNAIEWIKYDGIVRVTTANGNLHTRHPSYVEIYIGCIQCGLHHLNGLDYHGPSRSASLLRKTSQTVKAEYSFLYNKILAQVKKSRFQAYITQEQSARVRELSDVLSIEFGTAVTACFVAGLSKSIDWIPDHDSDAEENWHQVFHRSVGDFWEYMNRQER